MGVHVPSLIGIIVFYIIILIIGLWAARKTGFRTKDLKVDDIMLANRSIGFFVGCFTMTATWVGGGYINGTAEYVTISGLVWCQAPIGYALSLVVGGLFFTEKMRTSGFTTMLDPFHWKYGDIMNCLLYLPALMGDVFWSGAILAALGATIRVVIDLDLETAIIVSAGISLLYTILGGLYSVAYTDVIQLICMFFGLWLTIPFAMTHDAANSITEDSDETWLGELDKAGVANYIDFYLMLIFGGIPWQVYWQRALSAKTVLAAQLLSFLGALGCLTMAVPAILIGAIAATADWNETSYGYDSIQDTTLTLPLVIRYMCPTWVTFFGLGAVSAAVMSSTDSSVLSASSMFSRNVFGVVYARIFRERPSETAQVWVMRGAQVVITVLACVMAITYDSIYDLWVLCSDLVYVILFPQLVCVMYLKDTNAYGSLVAFVVGLVLRLLGGEPSLDIPASLEYPWYDSPSEYQYFPFRTLSMLVSLFTLIAVSYLSRFLFLTLKLPLAWDIYGCFAHLKTDDGPITTPSAENYQTPKPFSAPSEQDTRYRGVSPRDDTGYKVTKL